MKFTFTSVNISDPTLPVGTHYDTKQPGLVLNVTAATRRFGVYVWAQGSPTRKSIGNALDGSWSVTAARTEAARIISDLRTRTKTAKPKQITLGDLADRYAKRCELKGHRSSYMCNAFRLNWEHLRNTSIDDVTALEIADQHDLIAASRGPQAARLAVTSMRSLYALAIRLQLTDRNPALGVECSGGSKRDTFLTEAELVVMRDCLSHMSQNANDFFNLALLTGLRRSNIMGMEWSWLDLTGATVTIPAERSKNKRQMTIPLVPEAVGILKRRQQTATTPYVFTGRFGEGPMVEIYQWVAELRDRMRHRGVDKAWRTHDLRRTCATRMVTAGAPMPVISAALGHANMISTEVYAKADVSVVRQYMERASA